MGRAGDLGAAGAHTLVPGGAGGDGQMSLASPTARGDDGDLMEQSIRNERPGVVGAILGDQVLGEVPVATARGELASVITTRSGRQMGLKVGDRVRAPVQATNGSGRRLD